jgi:hypothetical protein
MHDGESRQLITRVEMPPASTKIGFSLTLKILFITKVQARLLLTTTARKAIFYYVLRSSGSIFLLRVLSLLVMTCSITVPTVE